MGTIGTNIKTARKNAGLSQVQLAQKAGITKAAISRYESGLRKPRAEHLKAMAEALGISTDELLGIPPLPSKAIPLFDNDPTLVEMPSLHQEYIAFNDYIKALGYRAVIELSPKNLDCIWTLYDDRKGTKHILSAQSLNKLMHSINSFAKYQIASMLENSEESSDAN